MGISGQRWSMVAAGEPFRQEQFIPESPGVGEVMVEIAGCGVCHTDLGYYYDGIKTKHALPLTLGHEISGLVVATGPDRAGLIGQSVIIPAVIPCGVCDLCQRGLGTICRAQKMPGNDIHGGFASHITVPAHGICPVDTGRLRAANLTLAEVSVLADAVTTPFQAAMLAGIQERDLAIVIGVGGVGGYAVQIARAMGATVVAIDVDQQKLDLLAGYGAALTLNAREYDGRALKKQVIGFAQAQGLRITEWKIFECSGTLAGQGTAFELLTYGAHLAVVGFTLEKPSLRLSNLMAFNARAQGNWGCLPEHYPAALELVLSGQVHMQPFVRLHPLDDINAVFAAAREHQLTERAVLVP
ncbi:MAG: 6-hydroxycyclohex-1-ene-1-carbonyl-CoA dehydrogenase [Gammaproteobacteria bacterium]|nr:6-hydroxycyclohex-1-ene-1-carbonyl-CoA dehydrogenase [Gammaproteobacteria bacterium]